VRHTVVGVSEFMAWHPFSRVELPRSSAFYRLGVSLATRELSPEIFRLRQCRVSPIWSEVTAYAHLRDQ
jgi:hypothetical protein